MTYEVKPAAIPPVIEIDRRATFPFEQLTVGTAFFVPADKPEQARCRVAATRYNKKHGSNVVCVRLHDGRMQVYIDAVPIPVTDPNKPSKQQFQQWIQSIEPKQTVSLGPELASMFADFYAWVDELNPPDINAMIFDADEVNDSFTVTRLR